VCSYIDMWYLIRINVIIRENFYVVSKGVT
jgi:hypothetical protein